MPLLHLDLPAVSRERPDLLPAELLDLPVHVQLAHLVMRAHEEALPRLHGLAFAGLAALRRPSFISQAAVRIALRCAGPGDRSYRVAAISGQPAPSAGAMLGIWFSDPAERWQLSRNAEQPARALDVRSLHALGSAPAP